MATGCRILRFRREASAHHFLRGASQGRAGVGGAAWKIFLLLSVYGSLYWASVVWAARAFELRREEVRRQLV